VPCQYKWALEINKGTHYKYGMRQDTPMSIRVSEEWLRWFEDWLDAQSPRPSKASVIRAGVEMFIASSTPHSRAPSTKSKTRPSVNERARPSRTQRSAGSEEREKS
jgi:hypothetical protein